MTQTIHNNCFLDIQNTVFQFSLLYLTFCPPVDLTFLQIWTLGKYQLKEPKIFLSESIRVFPVVFVITIWNLNWISNL